MLNFGTIFTMIYRGRLLFPIVILMLLQWRVGGYQYPLIETRNLGVATSCHMRYCPLKIQV